MTKSRLLDEVRRVIRVNHYSIRAEETYLQWIKRYIFFHHKKHPADMGEADLPAFLSHPAVNKNVTASTQNQALSVLLSLYKQVKFRVRVKIPNSHLPLSPPPFYIANDSSEQPNRTALAARSESCERLKSCEAHEYRDVSG